MRHSPLRHLMAATTAVAFMAVIAACSSSSPSRALPLPNTGVTSGAPAPSTATPSTAAPTTSTRRATHASTGPPTVANVDRCVSTAPGDGFYEAGRVASAELRTPTSGCTTISVSNVRDPANPTDVCQTFLVALWPLVDGSLTYTQPVTACGGQRTVLTRNVRNNAHYMVIYDIDYLEQDMEFRIWH
jgi:hypothetical protein